MPNKKAKNKASAKMKHTDKREFLDHFKCFIKIMYRVEDTEAVRKVRKSVDKLIDSGVDLHHAIDESVEKKGHIFNTLYQVPVSEQDSENGDSENSDSEDETETDSEYDSEEN